MSFMASRSKKEISFCNISYISVEGHDSKEDSQACMRLMMYKVKHS